MKTITLTFPVATESVAKLIARVSKIAIKFLKICCWFVSVCKHETETYRDYMSAVYASFK